MNTKKNIINRFKFLKDNGFVRKRVLQINSEINITYKKLNYEIQISVFNAIKPDSYQGSKIYDIKDTFLALNIVIITKLYSKNILNFSISDKLNEKLEAEYDFDNQLLIYSDFLKENLYKFIE